MSSSIVIMYLLGCHVLEIFLPLQINAYTHVDHVCCFVNLKPHPAELNVPYTTNCA